MIRMLAITDEYMREMLRTLRPYTVVLLRRTQRRDEPGADAVVWEHGRRNFELRRNGQMSIVFQVEKDESDVARICIFSTSVEEARRIMEGDPAVKAGIFVYDVHLVYSFPGDSLP